MMTVNFQSVAAILDLLGVSNTAFCKLADIGLSSWARARSGADVGKKVTRKIVTAAEELRSRAQAALAVDLYEAPLVVRRRSSAAPVGETSRATGA